MSDNRFYFRPLPLLSLGAATALATLLLLGVWQLRRAEWKTGLIEQNHMPEAHSLTEAMCGADRPPFSGVLIDWPARPVALRVYGLDAQSRPGWREFVIVDGPTCLGARLLAERAFLPAGGAAVIISRLRLADWPSRPVFAAANAPLSNEWHWFDAAAMRKYAKTDFNVEHILLNADNRAEQLLQMPPARHYGYAVSWFGMALALVVIYLLYHRQAGRLGMHKERM